MRILLAACGSFSVANANAVTIDFSHLPAASNGVPFIAYHESGYGLDAKAAVTTPDSPWMANTASGNAGPSIECLNCIGAFINVVGPPFAFSSIDLAVQGGAQVPFEVIGLTADATNIVLVSGAIAGTLCAFETVLSNDTTTSLYYLTIEFYPGVGTFMPEPGDVFVDNIVVAPRAVGGDQSVPEPGTPALLLTGLAALGLARRRGGAGT